MTVHTTAARTVVAANFKRSRGLAGALCTWPGPGSSGGRTPHGRTVNSTIHQTTKYTAMPVNRPIDGSVGAGLFQLDQRTEVVLRMQEQDRVVVCAKLRFARAQYPHPASLQLIAGRQDILHLVADMMDAA